jgi:HEAT repeat protein
MRVTMSSAAVAVLLLALMPADRSDRIQARPPDPPSAPREAEASAGSELVDEQNLLAVGLSTDGAALVEFLRDRGRTDADPQALAALAKRLGDPDPKAHGPAASALVRRGAVALPALRRAANDLANPQRAARARSCIAALEGGNAAALPHAVVRLVALRKPAGALEALLEYLPAAEDATLVDEITAALSVLAFPDGQPHPALLQTLADKEPLRRAVAGAALCRQDSEPPPGVRLLLKDPVPLVRFRAALSLAEAGDPEAMPVLIDLIVDLPADERQQAETLLQRLAGEWTPGPALRGEDAIACRIRRDAWAGWWNNTDGPRLLAEVDKRTLNAERRQRAERLIVQLGDPEFAVREQAAAELVALGAPVKPLLRAAAGGKDLEQARRVEECLRRIDDKGKLPAAAVRMLALRRPDGAAEALLAYLPCAADDALTDEVLDTLTSLAQRRGRHEAAVVRALEDSDPLRRAVAAEVLMRALPGEHRDAVRKLLREADSAVRVRAALALAGKGDKEAVPVLIDSLAEEPTEWTAMAEELLLRLAGDKAPELAASGKASQRRKARDAWAAWWKESGADINLTDIDRLLGLTLLVEVSAAPNNHSGRVLEVGRDGKPRWVIGDLQFPIDARVVPGQRVLIAEHQGQRVSERDFKGNVIWQSERLPGKPTNVQRLANGQTFVNTGNVLLELDRTGKVAWSLPYPSGAEAAYKGRDGVLTVIDGGECVRMTADGKEIRRFSVGNEGVTEGGIDVLPNGHVLIARPKSGTVVEFDANGREVWQVAAPKASSATALANGNVLIASFDNRTVAEVDRQGKVVWKHEASETGVFRARRR